MTFKRWFRRWLKSIRKMFLVISRKTLSEKEREEARQKRLLKKLHPDPFPEFNRKPKREIKTSPNSRLFASALDFFIATVAIILVPFGMFDFTAKKRKSKAAKVERAKRANNTSGKSLKIKACACNNISPAPVKRESCGTVIKSAACDDDAECYDGAFDTDKKEAHAKSESRVAKMPTAADHLSAPKSKSDKFIRKSMCFTPNYESKETAEKLNTGEYFKIELKQVNGIDRPVFVYDGKIIGYASDDDTHLLLTCLILGDKLYGAVTEISEDKNCVKYEAWISRAI